MSDETIKMIESVSRTIVAIMAGSIIGGEVIFNNTIEYDDWKWECPMPNLGG